MAEGYASDAERESDLDTLCAPNPSPMTQNGTNSYVIGARDVAVIDPGPAIPDHLDAIEAAVGGRRVVAVLVTHAHLDHSPGAPILAERLGAPVLAFGDATAGRSEAMAAFADLGGGEGVDHAFRPDRALVDGEAVTGDGWSLRAHWTPGHMGNHLSLEWIETGTVLTGDVVMGWASTMISPPDGDLGQFFASLDRLEGLGARRFLPGHGAAIEDPTERCRALRAHRQARGTEILAALDRPVRIADLVRRIYADTPPALHGAAARNVLAHLLHMAAHHLVQADPAPGPDALWSRR